MYQSLLFAAFSVVCTCSIIAVNAAVPVASFSVEKSEGVELLSFGDGQWSTESVCGKQVASKMRGSDFLYFKLSPEARAKIGSKAYLVLDYPDNNFCSVRVQYNAKSGPYKYGSSNFSTSGTSEWRRVAIPLDDVQFEGLQNSGADFRLRIFGPFSLSRAEIYTEDPGVQVITENDYSASLKRGIAGIPHNPNPQGMFYTLGDPFECTEPDYRDELRFGHCAHEATAKLCKSLGVTSFENYVTWETCEGKGEGQWDWSHWDRQVKVLKENDMKWVPFLILGPAYSTPDWFRASKDHYPCRCLEHGQDNKTESLWSPYLRKWIDRFLCEFAKRYKDTGVVESLLLGIQGDYGEAIYSATGGWTEHIPGRYHSHSGFWCDDPYALADFRKFIKARYNNIDQVNQAWGTKFKSLDEVDYPGRGDAFIKFRKNISPDATPQMRRQWLDFIDWYRDAMTQLVDYWMATARKYFPDTPIYLCTGGEGQSELGCNFAEQSRIAAKYKGGVRVTNEGSGYCWNFVITRWVASAGKHYGAYFSFEPAASINEMGEVARIYNATASGANQLHDYTTNLLRYNSMMDAQRKSIKYLFHVQKPIVPVALWYPNVYMTLKWGDYWNKAAVLRDYTDYDYVDESMLRTAALDHSKILVMLHGDIIETADAARIAEWVKNGGRLIVMDLPVFQSVEATSDPEKILFGDTPNGRNLGNGKILRVTGWDELAAELKQCMIDLDLPIYDLKKDDVYGTQIGENRFLFLNTGSADAQVEIKTGNNCKKCIIPTGSIIDEEVPRK
ncbi:MAG: family 14 glycosylhydrolase [Armatimonadota bacterium]|nr:family 14 glycosylhydrolase [bacterium]